MIETRAVVLTRTSQLLPNPGRAWRVYFYEGFIDSNTVDNKNFVYNARAVRGGQ